METKKTKFKRLGRMREIFVVIFVVAGLIVLQLPLPQFAGAQTIPENKIPIYLLCSFLIIFAILWHRVLPKKFLNTETRFFIETLVYTGTIFVIVDLTGGIYSYFNFLYFLPLLNTAGNLKLNYGLTTAAITSLLMTANLLIALKSSNLANGFSIFMLNIFGVWLVTSLGRFLATELSIIQKRQQEFQIEQLRQIDKLKDEFVFIIAHELRSPITAIRGYLELITTDSDQKIDQNLKNLLYKSFSVSNKLANLISLLLEVARIETGKIRFYLQRVDLKESVDFVANELKREVAQKEIELTINVNKENYILIDKERLEEIITIILDNAITYTPEFGKISITSQTTEKQVLLSVSDTGVGIPETMKAKLFDKLYTENTNSGEIAVKGYGIGLYVTKQLMIRMNGDVTFSSIPGRGTTFTIQIPKFWSFGK